MNKAEKERVVTELAERLRETDSLIVADYRGLTNAQLAELRVRLRGSGARLTVVKNTLTRRAAEEAGTDALLALLEGPTAIAFVESDGDPVAVAKALADAAKDTKVLALRGGILSGQTLSGADVEELAKLPAPDVVKAQLVGVIVAPLTQLAALVSAPLRDLVGLLDARIEQLGGEGTSAGAEVPLDPGAEAEAVVEETAGEAEEPEPAADGGPVAEATAEVEETAGEAEGPEPAADGGPVADATAEVDETTDETQEDEPEE